MSDDVKGAGGEYNPFAPENADHSGGGFHGKTVTITRSRTINEPMTYKDGSPVEQIDFKTKEKIPGTQIVQTGWALTWLAAGKDGQEREHTEVYGCGKAIVPTADGKGFQMAEGGPFKKFHANSGVMRLTDALKASGYDLRKLIVNGKQDVTVLAGASFTLRGEQKLGRDGKPSIDKGGYPKFAFYPAKFHGYAAGGNGHAKPNAAFDGEFESMLRTVLANGPLVRATIIPALATQFGAKGNEAAHQLLTNEAKLKELPWLKFDGQTFALAG